MLSQRTSGVGGSWCWRAVMESENAQGTLAFAHPCWLLVANERRRGLVGSSSLLSTAPVATIHQAWQIYTSNFGSTDPRPRARDGVIEYKVSPGCSSCKSEPRSTRSAPLLPPTPPHAPSCTRASWCSRASSPAHCIATSACSLVSFPGSFSPGRVS